MLPPIEVTHRVTLPHSCVQYKKHYRQAKNNETYIGHLKRIKDYLCKDESTKHERKPKTDSQYEIRPTVPVNHVSSLWEPCEKQNSEIKDVFVLRRRKCDKNRMKTDSSEPKSYFNRQSSIILRDRQKVRLSEIVTKADGSRQIRQKLSSKFAMNKMV